MLSSFFQYVQMGLSTLNLVALSNVIYKKVRNQKPSSHPQSNGLRKRKNHSDIEIFNTINPYLLGLTYAYSAYRLISQPSDPIAYIGTCIAAGDLYLGYQSIPSKRKYGSIRNR